MGALTWEGQHQPCCIFICWEYHNPIRNLTLESVSQSNPELLYARSRFKYQTLLIWAWCLTGQELTSTFISYNIYSYSIQILLGQRRPVNCCFLSGNWESYALLSLRWQRKVRHYTGNNFFYKIRWFNSVKSSTILLDVYLFIWLNYILILIVVLHVPSPKKKPAIILVLQLLSSYLSLSNGS